MAVAATAAAILNLVPSPRTNPVPTPCCIPPRPNSFMSSSNAQSGGVVRGDVSTSVAFNPSGNFDLSMASFGEEDDNKVNSTKDLLQRTVGFTINYEREDPRDPRELAEFPDIRLWFVRLDACYPWLPVVLDWRAGELARYAAMLVPHQMSMRLGVVFNPEALELFAMSKVFIVYKWLKQQNIPKSKLKTSDMARMLGFGIGDELYALIDLHPIPPP